ncbi:putative aminotransferase-like protein [Hapsidospora chrysogenum ATCC 11550]|uniref:Putative aminotransferase-like protein n=1 Tax=Hapsidospora chrysogenum (strain ATCC 11550 / CBS 779.69 / DSM 880 / IAM 14645 / JCM 23072 / IMI 49137) TaxID=857340 RepID=A0A086T1C4_HAPC1|nr:putative aminotransferase-like protein [Hapsidospora chrysogenum ATCC 11550]
MAIPVKPVRGTEGSSEGVSKGGFKQFGQRLKEEFPFDPEWRNLNHGSFGSYPLVIRDKRRQYEDLTELQPDTFIRRRLHQLIDESREAVAKIINAPPETVVFVGNATEGVNTVLRNLVWNKDGKDVIIGFNTMYDACARAEDFVVDYFDGRVAVREISLNYPLEDEEIISLFRDEVKKVEAEGKRARAALFDVVSSNPGLVFPWETMVAVCRELGVQSIVDGAQGIGMVHIDIEATNPDFFVSNCHKWLHVPRGCAVFHVPVRNQHLIPTTLATSRGYIPRNTSREGRTQPMPDGGGKNHFVRNFEWVGTRDDSPYLCVKDSIAWRRDVLGGENRIISYLWDLNKRGTKHVADALGTRYLENKKGTLTNCGMGNVALPLWVGDKGRERAKEEGVDDPVVLTPEEAPKAFNWFQARLMDEYKTFMAVWIRWDRFWVRISAQVYLDIQDYEWAANVLKELSERVARGEFRGT